MFDIIKNDELITINIKCDVAGDKNNELKELVLSEIQDGNSDVKMDMKDCIMIDSTGIGVLILTQNTLKKTGKRLEVINVSDDMMKMFRLMRLDQHFTISGR